MDNKEIFKKIAVGEVKTQSDYLADKIKSMIVTKELEEGYRFPNENDFCRLLSVGRGTLREAYKILDTQGYISRTKHGTYVRKKEDVAKEGNFLASLELAGYNEMVEFVCALEPEAVYLAAMKVTDEQLSEIEMLKNQCQEHSKDAKKLEALNYQFHNAIRNACGNQLIISALIAYYDIFSQQIIQPVYAPAEIRNQFIEQTLVKHEELWEALKNHDAKTARQVAYEHLQFDLEYRKKKMDASFR